MPRIDTLLAHPVYQEHARRIAELERDRAFCRHGLEHLLDVARIMWIANLEQDLGFDRELVYAAALLHDIGKDEQYQMGISHAVASERIAARLMGDLPCELRFPPEQERQIRCAILGHRNLRADAEPLEKLLYRADKASRTCFACAASADCNWSFEQKNRTVTV